jgi:chemotaxis protein CheD
MRTTGAADFTFPAESRFLNPGEWAIGDADDIFGTLLGSCVALTLWHPMMRIGAICHYVLPVRDDRLPPAALDGRYGGDAFALMERALLTRGVTLTQCQAKLFGGARVYDVDGHHIDVGARNIAYARQWLASRTLVLAAENVGGVGWRRLCFDLSTGEVWMRFNTQRLPILLPEADVLT